MDTNQKQPIQTNTFNEGMDTDTSDAFIKSSKYRLANNVRYITDTDSNSGELHMIEGATKVFDLEEDEMIIKTTSVRNIGILITTSKEGWRIRKFTEGETTTTLVFGPCKTALGDNISLVTRWESNEVIKLYIADGEHYLLSVNIAQQNPSNSIESISPYTQMMFNKPIFCGLVDGSIKGGLVQYSYRFYTKHGASSEISPVTKLISIPTNSTIKTYNNGVEEGKISSCGVKIKIVFNDDKDLTAFNRIVVYRIHYEQNGQNPTVSVIANRPISAFKHGESFNYMYVIDQGQNPLQVISLEEYNSMSGIHIIPKIIESKNDYLFAANIKQQFNTINSADINKDQFDDWDARTYRFNPDTRTTKLIDVASGQPIEYTIYELQENWNLIPKDHDCYNEYNNINVYVGNTKGFSEDTLHGGYLGGVGPHIYWHFVMPEICVDDNYINNDSAICPNTQGLYKNEIKLYSPKSLIDIPGDMQSNDKLSTDYMKTHIEINQDYYTDGYGNPYTSYMFKSLRRNELYRYGIILYDKYGLATPVKWIADIRTPNAEGNCAPYIYKDDKLYARPLGIKFVVQDLPEGCTGYEIVRCNRTYNDTATVTQGVVSRPWKASHVEGYTGQEEVYNSIGLLTVCNCWAGNNVFNNRHTISTSDDSKYGYEADNFSNMNTFQFVSAETTHLPETINTTLQNNTDLKLELVNYLYPKHNDDTKYGYNFNRYRIIGENGTPAGGYVNGAMNLPSNVSPEEEWINIGKRGNRNNADYSYFNAFPANAIPLMFYGLEVTSGNNKTDEGFQYKKYADSNTKSVTQNARSFIKLYNNTTKLHTRTHKSDYLNGTVYENTDAANNTVKEHNIHSFASIADFAIANEFDWSDLADEKEQSFKFLDSPVVIGSEQYTNWVGGKLARKTVTAKNIEYQGSKEYGQFNSLYGDGSTTNRIQIMGPGGRCLLLSIGEQDDVEASESSEYHSHPLVDTIGIQHDSTEVQDAYDYRSMLGTYVCNIRKSTVPYGGYTYEDRKLNTYYSYGNYNSADNQIMYVFDGDCFLNPLEYVSMHKYYSKFLKVSMTTSIAYSIPLESSINTALTYGFEVSKNKSNQSISNVQIRPSNVNNLLTQKTPLYQYNSVYSSESKARLYAAYDEDTKEVGQRIADCRCYYSDVKSNNEYEDSWLTFKPANYIDVDTRYGQITGLRTFNNRLIYWQDTAVGVLSVNERSTVTDNLNLPLILGTSGVLDRYDYISTSNGMKLGQFSDTQSDSTLYWWDGNTNELCAYSSGQVVSLCKIKNVNNLINTYVKNNQIKNSPILAYDRKFNELIAYVADGKDNMRGALVYSEFVQQFTSLYNIAFENKFEFDGNLMLATSKSVYKWNSSEDDMSKGIGSNNGELLTPYVKYIVNDNSAYTKVYDNAEIETSYIPSDLSNIKITFKTPLDQTGSLQPGDITNRERSYRFAIPRDNNSAYGGRLRGKTMQCELTSSSSSKYFSLQHIITKYRIS